MFLVPFGFADLGRCFGGHKSVQGAFVTRFPVGMGGRRGKSGSLDSGVNLYVSVCFSSFGLHPRGGSVCNFSCGVCSGRPQT